MPKTCPQCFKTTEEDRASCINRPMNMCPPPVDTKEVNAVEIVCAAPCGGGCGKHLAVPIGNIMKRRKLTELGTCAFDVCRARVVMPKAPANRRPPPPPISEPAPLDPNKLAGLTTLEDSGLLAAPPLTTTPDLKREDFENVDPKDQHPPQPDGEKVLGGTE